MVVAGYHYIFTTRNVVMTDGNYTGTLAIYDNDHNLVTSTDLDYYVSGNAAYPSNPATIQTWVGKPF